MQTWVSRGCFIATNFKSEFVLDNRYEVLSAEVYTSIDLFFICEKDTADKIENENNRNLFMSRE